CMAELHALASIAYRGHRQIGGTRARSRLTENHGLLKLVKTGDGVHQNRSALSRADDLYQGRKAGRGFFSFTSLLDIVGATRAAIEIALARTYQRRTRAVRWRQSNAECLVRSIGVDGDSVPCKP